MKAFISLLVTAGLFTAAGLSGAHAGGASELNHDLVASVNGVGIPRSYWVREVLRFEDQLRRQGRALDEEAMDGVAGQALDTLINMELLFQETRRRSIEITPEEIAEQVGNLRDRFPSESAFAAALEQMAFTPAELESELLRQLAIQQMLDRDIGPTVSISQEELRSYYDENQDLFRTPGQVRARHILIRLDRDADSGTERQARQRIEQIRQRILDGEDFGELAKELSEDASGSEGGDLGFFSREQMVPEFAEAAFSLPPKEPSEPVRTDFGYHLIEVIDRKEAGVLAFAEVEPQLRGFLRHERMMESLDRLVVELRDVAEIEKYSERLSAENLAPGTVQE